MANIRNVVLVTLFNTLFLTIRMINTLFSLLFLIVSDPPNQAVRMENQSSLSTAQIGYLVTDLSTGKTVQSYQAQKVLAPASVMKLFSTALALDQLGGKHQQKSKVYLQGKMQNGILNGNIIIDPNFNPSLGSARLGQNIETVSAEIKELLATRNIQKINGSVLVYENITPYKQIARTWIWEDMGNYFGSPASRCLWDENLIRVYFDSYAANAGSKLVKTEPSLPWLKWENQVQSSSINKDLAYAFSKPGDSCILMTGSIPENKTSYVVKVALPNPALSFAFLLKNCLVKNGISINDYGQINPIPQTPLAEVEAELLGELRGVELAEIIRQTNTHSINVWAETLLNMCYYQTVRIESKTDWFKKELAARFNVKGMEVFDGSGLSRFNAVSPNHLVNLLTWMNKHPEKENFFSSLAIAGETGTFKSLLKNSPAKGKVVGKSGYMSGVRCYAGYIFAQSGKKLAFAIQVNNFEPTDSELKVLVESWLEQIWKNN